VAQCDLLVFEPARFPGLGARFRKGSDPNKAAKAPAGSRINGHPTEPGTFFVFAIGIGNRLNGRGG
jgi:hypothetical protein